MVVMGGQWFSVTLCYYGLSFASTRLSDNLYTNFILRQVPSNANTVWELLQFYPGHEYLD